MDHRWLHAILDRGPAVVPEILAFADAGDIGDLDGVLVDLLHVFNPPEAVPYYIQILKQLEGESYDELTEAIVRQGAAAVEPLLALYEDLGEEVDSDVAFLLASLRVRDPRILEVLISRLDYDASDAAFCLGIYGDPAAKPALEKMLAEIPEGEKDFRREFQDAAAGLGESLATAIDEPFDIWPLYPEEELPPIDALSENDRLELLSHESAAIREKAAYSFFNTELSPKVRDRIFETAKSDADAKVRAQAWETLQEQLDETPIREAMSAVLLDAAKPAEERAGAAVGLNQALETPKLRAAVLELYDDEEARPKAMEAMWRSLDRGFAKYFAPHLDDENPAVRKQAVWGAGYMGLRAELNKLQALFDDEDLRQDALFAYALAMPGETTRGRIKGMYRKIETLAGEMSEGDVEVLEMALDERLRLAGQEPVYLHEHEDHEH
ncbi:MAG: hypothetical protein ABI823_08190 [Bryobacteraceae bacterium]